MLARWIPQHFARMLRLLPGQFPGDPREGDSGWQQIVRALAHAGGGDAITAIDATARTFTLADDQTARFPVGFLAECGGSSAIPRAIDGVNDGRYTVTAVALVAGSAVVTVAEAIPSAAPGDLGYLRGDDTAAVVAYGLQQIEEVLFDLRNLLTLRRATGRALEVPGEILGLVRTSTDDEVYRADLYLQAAINHSRGTIEQINAAAQGMAGPAAVILLLEHPLARIFLHVIGYLVPPATRARLRRIKAGGVAMDLIGGDMAVPFVFGYDMDAAGVGADPPGEDPDGEGFGEAYPIVAVLVGGAGAGAFYVANDCTAALVAGDPLTVVGSTNNDGTKTIVTLTYEAGPVRTRIDVAEAVLAVADGQVLDGGDGSGDFCEVW